MQYISIITLNTPGYKAALNFIPDLLSINPNYKIIIYHKLSNKHLLEKEIELYYFSNLDEIIESIWKNSDAIIWFTATGIVVRKIAPLIQSKIIDPAILVVNLDGTQIIPLLSGHIGKANELALSMASINNKLTPFITTATDTLEVFAFDLYTQKKGYEIINIDKLSIISNKMINRETITVVTYPEIIQDLLDEGLDPTNITFIEYPGFNKNLKLIENTVFITPYDLLASDKQPTNSLYIKVKPITIGTGLNKNTPVEEFYNNLNDFIQKNLLNINDIETIASFEAKKYEESLIINANKLNKKLVFFDKETINNLKTDFTPSEAQKHFNLKGVAEPTAILGSTYGKLFIKKQKYANTTFAAAF